MEFLLSFVQTIFFSALLLRFVVSPMLHTRGSKKTVQVCLDCLLGLLSAWLLVSNPTSFFLILYLAVLAVSGLALVVDLYVTLSWTPPARRQRQRRR